MPLTWLLRWPLHAVVSASSQRAILRYDAQRSAYPRLDHVHTATISRTLLDQALKTPSFRSLLYHRLRMSGVHGRVVARVLSLVYAPERPLYINCPEIGPGLYLSHGFATIIVAGRIGRDCMIAQQVTIGWSNKGGPPILGDRVRVTAGAKVLGPITLGDDVVVGANAVVIRDVPAGAVVGGIPARIIGWSHSEDRSGENLH